MKRLNWSLSFLLLCTGGCSTASPPAAAPAVTADEARAIRAAEAFLLSNGYGEQPADREALEFDAMERVYVQELGMPLDALLLLRHNTVCFPFLRMGSLTMTESGPGGRSSSDPPAISEVASKMQVIPSRRGAVLR